MLLINFVQVCIIIIIILKHARIGVARPFHKAYGAYSCNAESEPYLKYLHGNYLEKGGKIRIENVAATSSSECAGWAVENNFDIVMNCSGLGSRKLFNDPHIRPVRGQIINVKAPWLEESVRVVSDGK